MAENMASSLKNLGRENSLDPKRGGAILIRIGLNEREKREEINKYLLKNEIKKAIVFYPKKIPLPVDLPIPVEHVEYADIIMYKFFYRLLEEIDNQVLLVFNECMRTQNRSDLTYNCAHHYCGQTSRKIVFEHFPFIEEKNDFMILLDLINKGKYKGKSFGYRYLSDEDILVKSVRTSLAITSLSLDTKDVAKYKARKEQLFNNLGNADPDTIPRQLHIFAGNFKRQLIRPDSQYVARNGRFKLSNVKTYKEISPGDYTVIDFPHRRIDFNDFLKKSGMTDVRFISSSLKVDLYYIDEFKAWEERMADFYAHASLY